MSPIALDGTKLLILMGAGGIFALAGLWLMFRPPIEGEAARIEIFGLKFQSSSAGLLVFLIGAAFLALPIIVPERDAPREASGSVAPRPTSGMPPPRAPAGNLAPAPSAGDTQGLAVPQKAREQEVEPNDSIFHPNIVTIPVSVFGTISPDNPDVYLFKTDGSKGSFTWKLRSLRGRCSFQIKDQNEKEVRSHFASAGDAWSESQDIYGNKQMYMIIRDRYESCAYELFIDYD